MRLDILTVNIFASAASSSLWRTLKMGLIYYQLYASHQPTRYLFIVGGRLKHHVFDNSGP
jgi:hypothetical protein